MGLIRPVALRVMPAGVRTWLRRILSVPERLDTIDRALLRVTEGVETLRSSLPHEEVVAARGLRRYEFRNRSQHGEDGVLLYLFSIVGTTDRRFVEIGVGDGRECNSANLSLNFGWRGLLMDRSEQNVDVARVFYASQLGECASAVRIEAVHVTRENVNDALEQSAFEGEIDLLSIDVDGNDYWIWEAIEAVRPRVVVIEYNATLGWERPIVIPYDAEFDRFAAHDSGFYHGASLAALEKLGDRKGYCLVGCESAGVNAFFVRRDWTRGRLSEVPAGAAWIPVYARAHLGTTEEQFERIMHLPFEEV